MRQVRTILVLLVVAVGVTGCRSGCLGGASEPAAVERARTFLEAIQYRDVDRAWRSHVDSTRAGAYCSSDAFDRVLRETREKKTDLDCRDARKVTPRRRAELEDDAALLLQILKFTCEMPEGTCVDFQKRVFEASMPETDLWKGFGGFEIRRTVEEGDHWTIYVDIEDDESGETRHRSLTVRRTGEGWRVDSTE